MKNRSSQRKKHIKSDYFMGVKEFTPYIKPKMVHVAHQMLRRENLSEENFLGAQAVLILNGVL